MLHFREEETKPRRGLAKVAQCSGDQELLDSAPHQSQRRRGPGPLPGQGTRNACGQDNGQPGHTLGRGELGQGGEMRRDHSELQLGAQSGGQAERKVKAAGRGGGLRGLGEDSERGLGPGFEGGKRASS